MDDEDFYEYENQPEFIAERDVWSRVGGKDIGLGLGGVVNLKKSGYTVSEKFRLIAAATIKLMNETHDTEVLSDAGLTRMLGLVEQMPDFEFKNPSAFAMGYVVAFHSSNSFAPNETYGPPIDKKWLETVITINGEIEDKLFAKISDVDIVRYAVHCLINKLK